MNIPSQSSAYGTQYDDIYLEFYLWKALSIIRNALRLGRTTNNHELTDGVRYVPDFPTWGVVTSIMLSISQWNSFG